MNYVERVKANLEGCEAVSTGVCPGCEECRKSHPDFTVRKNDEGKYYFTNASDLVFPDEHSAKVGARAYFYRAWENCTAYSEPSFSWSGCDICGSRLGGDREVWHYVNPQGKIQHCDGACIDCVQYIANGTIPEEREK